MKKEYYKLVRDKIPEIIKKTGKIPTTRICTDDIEYKHLLKHKFYEEMGELFQDGEVHVEEIADVYEVLLHLADICGKTWRDIDELIVNKRRKNGSFDKRIMLLKVEDK